MKADDGLLIFVGVVIVFCFVIAIFINKYEKVEDLVVEPRVCLSVDEYWEDNEFFYADIDDVRVIECDNR